MYSVSKELFSIANNSTRVLHLIFVKSQVLIIQIIILILEPRDTKHYEF